MKPAIPWHLSPAEADALLEASEAVCDADALWAQSEGISPLDLTRERIATASADLERIMTAQPYRPLPGRFNTLDEERFRLLWFLDEQRTSERILTGEAPA
jgi:hypothetical protein